MNFLVAIGKRHHPADYEAMSNGTVRYLSLEWIDALTREVAASDAIAAVAPDHTVGITQSVTGGPEGDVTYHLQIVDGVATFGPGAAWPEDVRFEQDWNTAVAVATGTLNAQQAFITGRIRLTGDQQKLLASTPVFVALDSVFTTVREFTVYE
jgi:hypothetical protein